MANLDPYPPHLLEHVIFGPDCPATTTEVLSLTAQPGPKSFQRSSPASIEGIPNGRGAEADVSALEIALSELDIFKKFGRLLHGIERGFL
jgi:hypothetical protein